MSRIRTIKPEWLADERLLEAGSDARVMSLALILLSDDYGRGRASERWLAGQVFAFEDNSHAKVRETLAALSGWFVEVYEVRGQTYFEVLNWDKHQRVDRPGKPHVPEPPAKDPESHATDLRTYGPKDLGTGTAGGPVKVLVAAELYREVSGNEDLPAVAESWTSRQQEAMRTLLAWAVGGNADGWEARLRDELQRLNSGWLSEGKPVDLWARDCGTGKGKTAKAKGPAPAPTVAEFDTESAFD